MKFKYKFFILFALNSFLIIVLMGVALYLFLYRNFDEYINKVELNKLNHFVSALKKVYQNDKGWDSLYLNNDKWESIIVLTLGKDRNKASNDSSLIDSYFNNKKIPVDKIIFQKDGNVWFLPPDPMKLGERLFLLDENKNYIAGNLPKKERRSLKEIYINNKIIGYIGLNIPKLPSDKHPLSIEYAKTQINAIYFILSGIFIVIVILSYLFSRHLIKPIEQLKKSIKAIKSYQFDFKINTKSKDELGQLAEDFNNMAQTIKNYEKIRKQWISDISHELRTPVTIIRGKIEAAVDGIRDINLETMLSLKSDIIKFGKLIDDLHMLSLADSQNLYINKTQLNPLDPLIETIESFKHLLLKNQIEHDIYLKDIESVIIEGDRLHLIRLFSNLIENSIKYTDFGGKIRIKAICKDTWVIIYIEDSKPGVPNESLSQLFDRLYRVDKSRSRKKGSSGLGLSICKEIISIHNGIITSDHSQLGGLKITIQLPIKGVLSVSMP